MITVKSNGKLMTLVFQSHQFHLALKEGISFIGRRAYIENMYLFEYVSSEKTYVMKQDYCQTWIVK